MLFSTLPGKSNPLLYLSVTPGGLFFSRLYQFLLHSLPFLNCFLFFLGGVINFDPFITSQLQVTSHQLTYSTAVVLVSVKRLFLLTHFMFNKTSRTGGKNVFFKHEILKPLT